MRQCIIYCRVSSTGQEQGYSLDTQETACRSYATAQGLTVASVEREVWSGADRHRPALDALLDRLTPGDVVLAYALDRLSRSQVDTAILIDRIEGAGASLQLVTEDFEKSATGTFLRNAKAFVAELEREKIAERTQRGRRARVASGKPLAGPKAPYGYQWADDTKAKLIHDPETAPTVRLIFDLALTGVSLRQISDRLAAKGIQAPSGAARWQPSSLREILLRPTYAGTLLAYAATEQPVLLPGVAEPIVTAAEFAAAGARLERNKVLSTRRNLHPEWSLLRAGYIICGHCGWAMNVSNPSSRSLSSQYRCTAQRQHGPACPRPSITASMVDPDVWRRVASVLRDPRIVAQEVARRRDDGSLDRDLAALDKRIAALTDKQSRMARRVGDIDDDEVAAPLLVELKAMAAQKTAAERERADLRRRIADRAEEDQRVQSLADWCSRVGANLDLMSYDEKRLALDALGVKVRAYRKGTVDEQGLPQPTMDDDDDAGHRRTAGILYNSAR